jgi:predicted Zn-dependent protease
LFLAGALAAVHADPARAEGEGIYGRLEVKDNEEHLLKTAAATEDLFVRRGYRYDDRALGQAVTRIGARLAPRPSDPYIRYRFHVLRDIEPNAFALPDGQVYVNTGLLAILENEAQLAALLAHEVHHAAGHHGILSYRSARRKIIGSMVLGPLTLGVGDYFLVRSIFGYSRDLEEEADRLGAKRMVQAGYDPRQMADMLALLAGDPEGEQPKTRASKWSTHPELHARVATVRGLIPGLMVGRKPAALEVGAAGFRRLTRRAALDTAHDLVAADYPRTALALCSRLLNEKPDDPAAHYAAAEALRTLGARPALAGEQTLTDKEKRRNLRQRAYLTRDERQDRLIETEEGRQALSANMGAAVKSYRRALALDPSLAEAHRGLGFALEALGRPREAGQELVTYLRARPDAPDKPLVADRLRAITTTLKEGGSTR